MLLAKIRFFDTKCPLFGKFIGETCKNCEYLLYYNEKNHFVLCKYFTLHEEESKNRLLERANILTRRFRNA